MDKVLVVFYSYEGSTRKVAKLIARHLKADMLEIKPRVEMTSKGFSKFVWGGSQVVMGIKPKLLPLDKNIDDYDVIFLGSPIWAGTFSPPVKTVLESDYINNKKVVYFYSHDGGHSKAIDRAKVAIDKHNIFIAGQGFKDPLIDPNIEHTVTSWVDHVISKI